jgi:hypothetical protein
MNDGPFGDDEVKGLESSFFSSSLSFGEYAAPNGLCVSSGEVVLGLAGLALRLDCDGGVDPDENFELRLEIHEFRRPMGLGDGVDGFGSSIFSTGGGLVCTGAASFRGACFGSEGGGVGRAGLLLERDLRCDLD